MPPPNPETMKRSIRRISRTSHEALFTCPRKFYWGFEWQGAGLDTPLKDLKLLIGIAVHAGLEAVMKDPGMSPQGASTIARASFLEETASHREAWAEDPRALGNLEEAELLVGALVYGWVKAQLAAFLMRFEVIHSEEELETSLSPDVVLQSRLDVLVRERATGLIYVINWKCPSPEQPVSMADGTSKLARDVREGDWVLGSKGPLQVTAVGPGGVQPCYVLHTTLGRTIKASFEHPVLVRGPEGEVWVPLHGLVPGDELVLGRVPWAEEGDPARGALLGFLVGDGSFTKEGSGASVCFTSSHPSIVERVSKLGGILGMELVQASSRKRSINYRLNGALPLVRELGLLGKRSRDKFVPDEVKRGRSAALAFLGAYFDCDGHASVLPQGKILWSTTSHRLATDVQELLNRFGVGATVWQQRNKKYKASPYATYTVHVQDVNGVAALAELLLPYVVRPDRRARLEELRARVQRPARRVVRDFVKSVERVDAGETVAITTSGDHTITLGGVVTHNTTDKKDPEKLRDSYKEDSQMWAEALAAEQHLGDAVEGTILVGLFKGVIRNGSYTTPLLYYYEKEGVQRVGYQAGWAKVRADQHPDGLFGWIDNLPAETLAEQFYLCDPILKHNEVVEDRLAGWVYREGKAKYVLANGSEADKLLEFGARDGYWCMWCPFRAPCKEGILIERMVENGRLVKRVDHHGKGGGK